ncbi:MAG: Rpn family recombination-promoting nuclease/putative transposase [Candidatus Margulisbacteria bacterium]|jgi:predicted transposase/invertase (TIGR01784 family)|nr:Rpn family recombination-promoting nuclease/putative transposase [Candidatus Margulisiibacteriota bacterium]
MAERLNPLNDFLFMKYMGEKGDETQLLSFLNAVLKRTGQDKLQSVEILENKTLMAEIIGDKTSILDIRAVTDGGTKINIEVQVCNLRDMARRSLFYWSKEYSKGIKAGEDYVNLPGVITINIVNFEFIAGVDFHSIFHLREDTHRECLLTDVLEIHFIDMVKYRRLPEKDIERDPLQRWLAFFDKATPEKTLKEIMSMDKAIQEAQRKIAYASNDDGTLHAYQMREIGLSDWNSRLGDARREGRREGKLDAARRMKVLGMSLEQIRLATDLTLEEIETLKPFENDNEDR